MRDNDRFTLPLLIILAGGIVGVALDLDHVPVLLAKGLPVTLGNLATQAGRPFHRPALIISGGIFVYRLSQYFRLLVDMVRYNSISE